MSILFNTEIHTPLLTVDELKGYIEAYELLNTGSNKKIENAIIVLQALIRTCDFICSAGIVTLESIEHVIGMYQQTGISTEILTSGILPKYFPDKK